MPTLKVLVDDRVTFEGEVDEVVLPSRPELYPQALRPTPGQPPPPLARITMLTALVDLMRRTMESPMLQPIEVEIQTHGMGRFTMAVQMDLGTG